LARVVQRQFTLGSEHQPQVIPECAEYLEARFVLDNDCSHIAPLVRYLQEELVEMNICDDTAVMHVGVALEEALTNAIYHGNLDLESDPYDSSPDSFAAELQQRQHQPPYCDRRVYVTVEATREEARYVIRDEGAGFDKSIIPDVKGPLAPDQTRGRGLLLIHSVMDEVSYNESGNQITMVKKRSI
jgi:anti-sigma regulatory factor (Ser/Thr protein kinase)